MVTVALLNLAYFGVEFTGARAIDPVSPFANSVDFLEDDSLNILIAVALGRGGSNRARLGMVLAGILLIRGIATLWTAWEKVHSPLPPAADTILDGLASMLRQRFSARLAAGNGTSDLSL